LPNARRCAGSPIRALTRLSEISGESHRIARGAGPVVARFDRDEEARLTVDDDLTIRLSRRHEPRPSQAIASR